MATDSQSAHEPVLFTLERTVDPTGVSGTGRVLDGVVFHTGQVVICWRSDLKQPPGTSSLTVFPSVDAFLDVHVLSHGISSSRVRVLHGMCDELTRFA
jgi:hypothetical protein